MNYVNACNITNIHHDTWYTFLHSYIIEAVKMSRALHKSRICPSASKTLQSFHKSYNYVIVHNAPIYCSRSNVKTLPRIAVLCGSHLSEAQLSATIAQLRHTDFIWSLACHMWPNKLHTFPHVSNQITCSRHSIQHLNLMLMPTE